MTLPLVSASRVRTAPEILEEAARLEPDHVRLVDDTRRWTLGELSQTVGAFAARLRREWGVCPGDRVALLAPNSVEWVLAALAVQRCGAAWAGVHAGSSASLVETIVAHARPRLLIATGSELARIGGAPAGVPVLELSTLPPELAPAGAPFDADPDRDACVIYTSGTTGRPKGVVLTHRNLASNGEGWMARCADLVPERAREVTWLPFSHVFGWGGACIGTAMGFTSTVVAPADVASALVRVRPHVLMTVPLLLERLARGAADGAELVRSTGGEISLILAGGAPLAPSLKAHFRGAGLRVLEGYGLSETSPTVTLERSDDPELDSAGAPYPSIDVRLAADGEILVRGPSVFRGYLDDPDATAAAIDAEGFFHTGDVGSWTPRGNLRVHGRKNDLLVLSSGKKVAPGPIEALAATDPRLARVVLFGGGPHPVALVWPSSAGADAGAAIADLNARLSTFERVRAFAIAPRELSVEAGEITPSLKIRRHAIARSFEPTLAQLAPNGVRA